MAQVAETRMTAAEFARLGETNQIMELIEGELVRTPTPIDSHQVVVIGLLQFLRDAAPTGRRCHAPCDVYLGRYSVLQPDVLWISNDNTECMLVDGRFHGPPDLVVEVVSPNTELRDRRDKYRIYEKQGVKEYWIADADAPSVEVYQLVKGKYQRLGVFASDETFQSTSLGKPVDLKAIFLD